MNFSAHSMYAKCRAQIFERCQKNQVVIYTTDYKKING